MTVVSLEGNSSVCGDKGNFIVFLIDLDFSLWILRLKPRVINFSPQPLVTSP